MRVASLAAVVVLCICGCGGSSNPPHALTAADVAVQPSDVPQGMTKCDVSGGIDTFIKNEQSPDPSTSTSTSKEWSQAQKNGATAAYVAIYTNSAANCSSIKSSSSTISAATYKLVVNFVIQFKDEKSAEAGFKSDNTIFGFSASQLRSAGSAAQEGTATGLTANSIALSQAIANQTFYIAVWQNQAFMIILAILNVDPAPSKKVATSENGRIK